MPDQDKYFLQAHKNVTRARTQLVLNLSNKGFKKDEINGVLTLINWKEETEWQTEELRDKEKTTGPVAVTIPPTPAPPTPINEG